jgi:hypothetical protein
MSFNKLMGPGRCFIFALMVFALALGIGIFKAAAQKNPRAEEVVERTINAYGSRAALYTVQHNGILRGLITLMGAEGKREGKTTTKFIRKPLLTDDLLVIEVELSDTKFTIGYDGKQTWTLHNGEPQEPSPETVAAFRAAHLHSYEALLRYKENNAKLEYVRSDRLGPIEWDVIDLVAPDGSRTRYEISRRTSHIMYLEYESKSSAQAQPSKYRLHFTDFRVIQNTLVPFKTLVFENGRQVEDRRLVEAAFNVQLEEKAFQSEKAGKDSKATETAIKP